MPKIAELMQLPDGRLGVALDMPDSDDGELTLWTGPERERAIKAAVDAAVEEEREACARTAEGWGSTFDGADGLCRGIAADIRARSKS